MGFDWGAWVQVPLGQVYLLAGRATDAFAVSQQALAIARHRGARLHEAYAGWLVGEAAALVSDLALAERHYRDGLKLATDLGMLPLVAHCHLGLGKLYRQTGDNAKAQEHLTTAVTMYREMGMTFWLEQAEAAMSALH